MSHLSTLVVDFDSTFVSVEALDALSRIVLRDNPQRNSIVDEIESITQLGMNGSITFSESLSRRLSLFLPEHRHIDELIKLLSFSITPSIERNLGWIHDKSELIYIISGGFYEYIVPVVSRFGILPSHVLANHFLVDESDVITGYDATLFLAQAQGKVKQVEALGLRNVIVVGDGYTDYEIRKFGQADLFVAFTENVRRDIVCSNADFIAPDFDSVITLVSQQ